MTPETMAATSGLGGELLERDLGGLLGLRDGDEVVFPLREVRVRASIAANCCRMVIDQIFDNPYDTGLEAVHIFPLPEDGAVTDLELRAGDSVVRAECRERAAAERAFGDARRSGKRAALLTRERPDVHTLRVTNIPAKTSVAVRLVVVERLTESDGAFLWRFPTVIAPRYTPGSPIGHSGDGVTPDTDRVPDASRLQPPLLLGDGAMLDIEVEIAGPLASLESSLHAVRATFGTLVKVAPSARATLDRDFVLRVAPLAAAAEPVRAWTDGEHTVVVVDPAAARPVGSGATGAAATAPSRRIPRDAVFVVDISGSMEGLKIDAARRALSAALHGLEPRDRFRLIAFDSKVETFRDGFSDYTASSLSAADQWIASLAARGGTEMLPALVAACAGAEAADRLRTILFITDGEVTNADELVAAVAKLRGRSCLYTVGIDTAVNGSLLKRLARAGGGTCELLTPSEDVEEGIARLEARFGTPLAVGVMAVGGEAAWPDPAVLFEGRPAVLLLRGGAMTVEVRATTSDAGVVTLSATAVPIAFPLGALWARERIAWLEDRLAIEPGRADRIRAEMLPIALAHHIASPVTAFVAVEERRTNDGELVTVVQPVPLPFEWDQAFAQAPGMVAFGSTAACLTRMEVDAADLASMGECSFAETLLPPPPRRSAPMASALRLGRLSLPPGRPIDGLRHRVESALATSQGVDGSFDQAVERTAAALLVLLVLGHTRRRGSRRRVVGKAAAWLLLQPAHVMARAVLELLDLAEAEGAAPDRQRVVDRIGGPALSALLAAGPEGKALTRVLDEQW